VGIFPDNLKRRCDLSTASLGAPPPPPQQALLQSSHICKVVYVVLHYFLFCFVFLLFFARFVFKFYFLTSLVVKNASPSAVRGVVCAACALRQHTRHSSKHTRALSAALRNSCHVLFVFPVCAPPGFTFFLVFYIFLMTFPRGDEGENKSRLGTVTGPGQSEQKKKDVRSRLKTASDRRLSCCRLPAGAEGSRAGF